MTNVTAKCPILYKGRQYIPGETIKCADREMIEAWKRAESIEEQTEQEPPKEEPAEEPKEEPSEEIKEEPTQKAGRKAKSDV